MASVVVQGRHGVLSAAGIGAYRRNGFLIANGFFSAQETDALTNAVRAAARRRGPSIFPGMDAEFMGEVRFDSQRQPPKPSVQRDPLSNMTSIPAEVKATSAPLETSKGKEYRQRTLKSRRLIDRAYQRLARRRALYKGAPHFLSEEDETAVRRKARAEPRTPLDLRRESRIDSTFAFIGAWCKCWAYLLLSDAALREVVVGEGGLGRHIGEAAAALSGEVVVRVLSDTTYESYPFMNATPVFFAGAGGDVVCPTALGVMVGLSDCTGRGHVEAQRLVVLPGSHNIILALTNNGADAVRFQMPSVFDFGVMVRRTPELRGLEPLLLPPLAPGSALFLSHFTLTGTMPTLAGSALSPFQPPPVREVSNPYQFSLTLMADRCAFSGERNSWASRDSHGPLRNYEKGQLLVDDALFPVLHRALDIE